MYATSHSLAGTLQRMVTTDKTHGGIGSLTEYQRLMATDSRISEVLQDDEFWMDFMNMATKDFKGKYALTTVNAQYTSKGHQMLADVEDLKKHADIVFAMTNHRRIKLEPRY